MLQEVLLALSGHKSQLLDAIERGKSSVAAETEPFPLLSPPEIALLQSVGHLARLHRQLRTHTAIISSSHPSPICRAVSSAVSSSHLARFQEKILEVECRILKKDASMVGAYNIVPLAGVVAEFDGWKRLLEWYWNLACDMLPYEDDGTELALSEGKGPNSSGAGIINKLRQDAQTGYPDIEAAALQLSQVAESAWLRQLVSWILYGRLPTIGAADFFVQLQEDPDETLPVFYRDNRLLPKFVSNQTASSIFFVGKTLNHIKSRGGQLTAAGRASSSADMDLIPVHIRYLSDLKFPISSAALASAVTAIRLSLSRNTLRQLLPVPKIVEVLSLLQEYFLLGRGEFAVALISEADRRIGARHSNIGQPHGGKAKDGIYGVLLKEGEVSTVLADTWSFLSTFAGEDDQCLDLAKDMIRLVIAKPLPARPATPGRASEPSQHLPTLSSTSFNDALLLTPTTLLLDVSPPMDLFLTAAELEVYSSIHPYLLAIRRAHLHLADLWRQTALRREYPAPIGPPQSGRESLRRRRLRSRRRGMDMRNVWATCGLALFLLSETAAYFEGEVVQGSWEHLHTWISSTDATDGRPRSSDVVSDGRTTCQRTDTVLVAGSQQDKSPLQYEERLHDPESLSKAHRKYLSTLAHCLLLTDVPYTRLLKSFLTHIDHLVATMIRLHTIQQNLDLEQDDGVVDPHATYAQDEREAILELERARVVIDSDMNAVIERLREIDAERLGVGALESMSLADEDGYEPWKGAGINRLLMKLDFGSMVADEDDFDSE